MSLQAAPGLPLGHQGAGELLNGITPGPPASLSVTLTDPVKRGFPPGSAAGRKARIAKAIGRAQRLMLSIIFGPRQAYTTLATFPTLRAPMSCHARRCIAILKSFDEGQEDPSCGRCLPPNGSKPLLATIMPVCWTQRRLERHGRGHCGAATGIGPLSCDVWPGHT